MQLAGYRLPVQSAIIHKDNSDEPNNSGKCPSHPATVSCHCILPPASCPYSPGSFQLAPQSTRSIPFDDLRRDLSGIAMEIFIEQNKMLIAWSCIKFVILTETGALAFFIF
jgi:hypothetical protein